ncbi:hypothetical protein VTO73DRAFT_11236 [Trametes versicolor]
MSPYKQFAGASSSGRGLNGTDDMDNTENINWLQQRYPELAHMHGIENVPEQPSTLWAPRHTDTYTTNGFDRDEEAHLRQHINTFVDDSILLNTFMGRGEDLEDSNRASAQDAYGLPLIFDGHMGDTAQMELGMDVLDPPYQLGEAFLQPRTLPDESYDGPDATADLFQDCDFTSLSRSFFDAYVADPWAAIPGYPTNLASTSDGATAQGSSHASQSTPTPAASTIDPALQAQPPSRSTTPPVLQDIDPLNSSPERPPHPAVSTMTGKTKRTTKAKRGRSGRENVPSIIPAPPPRPARRRAPEAEEEGPSRKRRRHCELEETQGTEETRCGLDGCEEVLRASDVDAARKHFNTHVKSGATIAKGKKGKKAAKDKGKDQEKKQFRCSYIEADGKACTHGPWAGKQGLQRHVEGTHYKWSFECPVKTQRVTATNPPSLRMEKTAMLRGKRPLTQDSDTRRRTRLRWRSSLDSSDSGLSAKLPILHETASTNVR